MGCAGNGSLALQDNSRSWPLVLSKFDAIVGTTGVGTTGVGTTIISVETLSQVKVLSGCYKVFDISHFDGKNSSWEGFWGWGFIYLYERRWGNL